MGVLKRLLEQLQLFWAAGVSSPLNHGVNSLSSDSRHTTINLYLTGSRGCLLLLQTLPGCWTQSSHLHLPKMHICLPPISLRQRPKPLLRPARSCVIGLLPTCPVSFSSVNPPSPAPTFGPTGLLSPPGTCQNLSPQGAFACALTSAWNYLLSILHPAS